MQNIAVDSTSGWAPGVWFQPSSKFTNKASVYLLNCNLVSSACGNTFPEFICLKGDVELEQQSTSFYL